MEYMNILKSSLLACLQWISFLEKLSLQSTFLSYQSLGGVYPAEGMINGKGQGHFRSLIRGVLGILGFGAVYGPWMGRRGVGGAWINPSSIVGVALSIRGCGGGLAGCIGVGAWGPGGVVGGFFLAWGWLFLGVGWAAFWCWAFAVWVLFVLLVRGGGRRVLGNNQIISVQRAARLPRFILVVGFSDTLLVVSILDISLWLPYVSSFAVLKGLLIVPVGAMGSFWPGVNTFKGVGRCGLCPRSRAWCAHLVIWGLSWWGGHSLWWFCRWFCSPEVVNCYLLMLKVLSENGIVFLWMGFF